MRFSNFLFRFRMAVIIAISVIGFWAPWERLRGAHPGSTWLWLAGSIAAHSVVSISTATNLVVGIATLLLLCAALVRTWATAYLGSFVVHDRIIHSERVVASGPYRYVRNPLYLGTLLLTLGLAILMPPGGAAFVVIAMGLLIVALIHSEEHYLTTQQGEDYAVYMRKVPRFLPALTPRILSGTERPHWLQGFLGEIHIWGMVLTYLVFAHRYNVGILEQGVLISLGITFLVRAIWRPSTTTAP